MNEIQSYIDRRLKAVRPEFAWTRGSLDEMSIWQVRARSRIFELLGGLDRDAPEALGTSSIGTNGFERVRFSVCDGLDATGMFLPSGSADRSPAVVCIPGHGAGVEAIVGQKDEAYQADFALQGQAQGFHVLALEPFSFGGRVSERVGPHGWSCEADAKAALMLGETLAGWRIAEAMRAVDYLASRPEVDPGRIAIMGISGGGMIALWTAALDPRISAAVVSGYFCTFRDSILAIDHCLDNFVPGILRVMEMPDFAGLIAPRALFVESGTQDSIFPVAGFRTAVRRSEEIFGAFGVPGRFGYEEFEGDHRFHGVGAFEFLGREFGLD